MKILILGSAGLQGKAVLHDLSKCPTVKEMVCVDASLESLADFKKFLNTDKITFQRLDVKNREVLISLMKDRVDIVIDVLPSGFTEIVVEAALEAKVNVVNTRYGHTVPRGLNKKALEKGITFMPESGLDPGIDLVLCGYGVSQMDEVSELHSYCGGFPEPKAADNPLKYKITWTWNGVLLSYKRPAKIMRDGKIITIPAQDQHAEQWIDVIDFPGVGKLELIPNGDAIIFTEYLGISNTLRSTTRCSMRWPGHCAFWKKLVDLGFLSDEPVKGLPFELTPHQFMVKHLEPQLQYGEGERDVVAMRNTIIGVKGGKKTKITYDMIDMRDMETGLFAMNRTVGYTASIIAQMIVNGEINRKGLLTAVRDVPHKRFLEEIKRRGITVTERVEN
jgi:saccharopine dehydrogenase-like NADP-dependent oxidoreductase